MLVLARLLTPSDFGLIAMVTTFSLMLSSFGLAGFTEAVIQAEEMSHARASTLFWVNLTGGLFVAGTFAAAGRLLAKLYGQAQITAVCVGFAIAILLSVAPVLHLSLLKRATRFDCTAIIDIAGRIAYVGIAVASAWHGWGYWSLVFAAIAQGLMVCIGSALFCTWLPGLPRRGVQAGASVRYAFHVYGRYSLNYLTGNTDNFLVGWRFGTSALGFYKKAFDLFVLPSTQLMSPILAVVVGSLSRLSSDHEEFRRFFYKGLGVVALLGMGAGAGMMLVGGDLVLIFLGSQWTEAGRIFTYFGPGIGLMLVYQTAGWIHLSLGTTARWFRWTIFEIVTTVSLVLIGMHWGLTGVASAWTASFIVLIVPTFNYAGRSIGICGLDVLRLLWKCALAAALAMLGCWALLSHLVLPLLGLDEDLTGALIRVGMTMSVFVIVYALAIVLIYRSTEPIRLMLRLLSRFIPSQLRAITASKLSARLGTL